MQVNGMEQPRQNAREGIHKCNNPNAPSKNNIAAGVDNSQSRQTAEAAEPNMESDMAAMADG